MKKILIIEDDESIAELERDYLEITGFKTEIAQDGYKGLDLALNEEFDLILLDVMLPGKDGFKVCQEIRAVKEIPILMVTAKKEDIYKIQGLGIGADDYIVKPFSPSELVARVNAHISRYERLTTIEKNSDNEKSSIIIGRIKILLKARRVYIGENEVKFANKEFELLMFLASNPNIVFSKDTLLDRIWGEESLGDSSTITVHINRIREKIELDSSNPEYIETVWGAGYRFNL
ncbi:response regulator transcription factor [Clostridium beijerinckii]|jgi:DNA-binding response OmpR family regulator|uniref:Stage 0 sporulation protein A homolog n=2 Tax=Clostridium beijerinckii TaxID=1520 RepID=A0A1S8RV96_CLOBE|nr:response regulator transcription factor [Clostridium beijerinckii]ABR33976.1 two component transcriptional regulator, winged helix family [Clostridium beijerinckii NCIMB 8052]AIU03727.1 two component transcriptional regulator [Clostridium beijerinckii ATCC 35702]ALB47001.1 DNA-binding response regulator [Clostridium beijerinckii NRRL B-598]MBF7811419.1 response regulator transcription factor [Clostridium beijerinckii]NRT24731.1 DNA-binding response OmpR family regulator [Clostridium beijeri